MSRLVVFRFCAPIVRAMKCAPRGVTCWSPMAMCKRTLWLGVLGSMSLEMYETYPDGSARSHRDWMSPRPSWMSSGLG